MSAKTDVVATKTKSEPPENKSWRGAFTVYGDAMDRLMKNNKPALLLLGVTLALSFLSLVLQSNASRTNDDYVVLTDVLYLVFLLAIPTYGLAIADNKQVTAAQIMQFDLRKYLSLFAAFILTVVIIVGSVLLFIIPAIWTIAWFYLTAYALVDKNLGPIEALKESKRLAAAHKGKVWGLIGVSIVLSIGVNILSYLPLIGDVAAMAISIWVAASAAMLYRWLQKQPQTPAE